MKKVSFLLILAICTVMSGFGQSGPKDLILLLDTSASMSASYQEVNNYISGALLIEHLRIGDTFHLIPFAGTARLDISRRVEGRGELETIIGRMSLQYPLDSWSDIPRALNFAENYATMLPSRPKRIILVTDGALALPPGSSSASMDDSGLDKYIADTKTRFGRNNISLEYVKVVHGQALPKAPQQRAASASPAAAPPASAPPRAAPAPAATGSQTTAASQSGAAATAPSQTAPAPAATGQASAPTTAPTQAAASSQSSAATTVPSQTAPAPAATGSQTAAASQPELAGSTGQPLSEMPGDTEQETAGITQAASETDLTQAEQDTTDVWQTDTETITNTNTITEIEEIPPYTQADAERDKALTEWNGRPIRIFVILALIGFIDLLLLIYFISRELHSKPNKVMARAAAPARTETRSHEAQFADHSRDLASFAATQHKQRTTPYDDRRPTVAAAAPQPDLSGPMMLNLFVEDQNTLIGKRNIHSIKSGISFTVGGGSSDFLIFLVPFPADIGIIRRDGNRYTFIPKKAQYFPDIGSQQVSDCIGKTIRIISDKNYELRFRFEYYEDPLKALNKLLNSVKIPG